MSGKIVRIGCASGFWGDSAMAAPQLVRSGAIDYLVFDYLAEVTMSILAQARMKDATKGYATDFVDITMKSLLRDIKERGIRVVSNAGGINPLACRDALQAIADAAGIAVRIGVVLGDELTARQGEFKAAGATEMFSGAAFPKMAVSVNAYLGARAIATALDQGCDIVITGRVVDSAVTLGPLMHEFGWRDDDYHQLAQGSLAGHIVECGAQATGGLFTDWQDVPDWETIGYPIVEVEESGAFTVTKPAGTGGLVSFGTVAEQVLYEIGDPNAYIMPDVVCDFTQVRIEPTGDNRVRVSGARGTAPTDSYKTSATFVDGFRNTVFLTIMGIDAAAKARRTAAAILARTRKMFLARNLGDYTETRVEILGAEDSYGAAARDLGAREAVMKLAARHPDKAALDILAREFVAPGTSMAPGTTGLVPGRPSPSPVVRLFSFLVPKSAVAVTLDIGGQVTPIAVAPGRPFSGPTRAAPFPATAPSGDLVDLPLVKLCWGRSGDKGNKANIGLIARDAAYLPLLSWWLTPERVADRFAHNAPTRVERFDLPGFNAFNFLLHDVLGGGGMASLHTDNLAKAYAQNLLSMTIPVPPALAARLS